MRRAIFIAMLLTSTAIGATVVLNAFNAGELSPQIEGRTDVLRYYHGCRTLENMVPLPHGGAMKRSGGYYIADANLASNIRIIPFEYSVTQAYIIEAGHGYLRFYKEQ